MEPLLPEINDGEKLTLLVVFVELVKGETIELDAPR